MSDTSQGPGWWLASDGKWYPPELWTGPPNAGPAFPQGTASANPSEGGGGVPQATNAPWGGQIPPVVSGPYAPYGGPPSRRNNGLAVASLVCACAGFLFLLPAILGVIFGFVARSQIRQSGGAQGGDGLAVAGIIVGFAWIGLFLILVVISAATTNSTSGVLGLATTFALPGINE